MSSDGETLLTFDVYRSTELARATLVWGHGGGFISGCSRDRYITKLVEALANDRITIIAINYRKSVPLDAFSLVKQGCILEGMRRTKETGLRIEPSLYGSAFYAAVEDFGEALKVIRSRKDELGAHGPIIAGGYSAGGITAFSSSYPPSGEWEDLPKPDASFGVSAAMVQPWRLTVNGPPCTALHAVRDRTVSARFWRKALGTIEKSGAPFDVVIASTYGHSRMMEYFMRGVDESGKPYLDQLRYLISSASCKTHSNNGPQKRLRHSNQ